MIEGTVGGSPFEMGGVGGRVYPDMTRMSVAKDYEGEVTDENIVAIVATVTCTP